MTLEEAKKILEKEGYFLVKVLKGFEFSELPVWEKQEVVEAKRVVNENGFATAMNTSEWLDRQERLKKEYGKNHIKGDFSWKNSIIPGSPALNESASQFNDALLDEQAKEIERLKNENEDLKSWHEMQNRGIALSNIAFRNEKNRLGKEIAKLNGIIHDKNAVLSDVAEELRLTKIREKNLVEVSQKYMKENEELKEQLADNVVDKIDAQTLKSAESALAYKEKAIADLGKKLKAQKDLVDDISLKYDGAKYNLKLRIDECEKLKKELEKMTKLVETVRKGSKEYCDYGIAAGKMIQKMAKVIVNEGPVSSEDFKEYRRLANGGIFMPEISEEELMKLQEKACVDIAEEGGDLSGVIVLCGKDLIDALKKVKDVWQE